MNTILENILNTYTSFFISTLKRNVSADEVNRFLIDSRAKGVAESYLYKIVKVTTDNGDIPIKQLIS